MAGIHITDIEAAINHWRARSPSPDGVTACPEVRALAEVYALMVWYRESHCDEATMPAKAHAAWLAWYATTPDTPCIAICSTSQGDALCKGCGRTFDEVQHWTAMTPAEKRGTWRRIVLDGTAWRFNRYAERAGSDASAEIGGPPPSQAQTAEATGSPAAAAPEAGAAGAAGSADGTAPTSGASARPGSGVSVSPASGALAPAPAPVADAEGCAAAPSPASPRPRLGASPGVRAASGAG